MQMTLENNCSEEAISPLATMFSILFDNSILTEEDLYNFWKDISKVVCSRLVIVSYIKNNYTIYKYSGTWIIRSPRDQTVLFELLRLGIIEG